MSSLKIFLPREQLKSNFSSFSILSCSTFNAAFVANVDYLFFCSQCLYFFIQTRFINQLSLSLDIYISSFYFLTAVRRVVVTHL